MLKRHGIPRTLDPYTLRDWRGGSLRTSRRALLLQMLSSAETRTCDRSASVGSIAKFMHSSAALWIDFRAYRAIHSAVS